MEAFIEALFDTKYGLIALGALLLIALIVDYFSNNKPKMG